VFSFEDAFTVAPSLGRAAFLTLVGRHRSPSTSSTEVRAEATALKGIWRDGSQCIEHLRFVIDTHRVSFGVPAQKLDAVSSMARQLLASARCDRRVIQFDSVESFIGKAESLGLAMPDTAFHLRALYDSVPAGGATGARSCFPGERYRGSCMARLSHRVCVRTFCR
jgi:hypothetical protein